MVEHALAPPAGKIRHIDLGVSDEMHFRLVDDPPTAGAAASPLEGPDQFVPKPGRRHDVGPRRARLDVELAVEDFPYDLFG